MCALSVCIFEVCVLLACMCECVCVLQLCFVVGVCVVLRVYGAWTSVWCVCVC